MNFERHEFPALEVSPAQLKGVLQCVLHSVLFNRALGSFAPKDAECNEFGGPSLLLDPQTGASSGGGGAWSVPYAKLDEPNVDGLIDAFLERFAGALSKAAVTPAPDSSSGGGGGGGVREGQVCLGFHEKVVKKKNFLSWGGPSEEKVFWERWIVPIRCDATAAPAAQAASAGAAAEAAASSAAAAAAPASSSISASGASPSSVDLSRRARLVECLTYLVFRCNEKREHIPPLKSSSNAALAFSFELSFSVGGKKDDSWSTFTKLLAMTPPMLKLQ